MGIMLHLDKVVFELRVLILSLVTQFIVSCFCKETKFIIYFIHFSINICQEHISLAFVHCFMYNCHSAISFESVFTHYAIGICLCFKQPSICQSVIFHNSSVICINCKVVLSIVLCAIISLLYHVRVLWEAILENTSRLASVSQLY